MDFDFGLNGILANSCFGNLYNPYNTLGNNNGFSFQNILSSLTAYNSPLWQNNTAIGNSAVVVPAIASLDKDGNISHYLVSGKKLVEETGSESGKADGAENVSADRKAAAAKTAAANRKSEMTSRERAIAAYRSTMLKNGFGFF